MRRFIKRFSPQLAAAKRILRKANAARDLRDWAAAAALYDIYLAGPPASQEGHIWVQLGHSRKEVGNLTGAVEAYQQALEFAPNAADTYLHLGHLQYRMGAVEEGIASLREALRLDPDIGDAREAIEDFTQQSMDPGRQRRYHLRAEVDAAWYSWFYPDVAGSGLKPSLHHARIGMARDRSPVPSIAPSAEFLAPVDHEPQCAPNGREWAWSFSSRMQERLAALRTMVLDEPFPGEITFSIATAVYNTKPAFLKELAQSIADQAFQSYEWIVWDNGSTDPRTIVALEEIAAINPRCKVHRSEKNLHIIGGNLATLNLAKGRYFISVDHDDLLYPDSLALFANVLRKTSRLPDIIYSDEQKITEAGEPFELMWRWTFSRAQAIETLPAAHLMAISTAAARDAKLYTGDYAQGSHDWDSWLRLIENDIHVVHIPEVLYGWRIHFQSTAGSSRAKTYIGTSQNAVVAESLRRRKLNDLFESVQLFSEPGWYRARRLPKSAPACQIDFVVNQDRGDLARLVHNLTICAGVPGRTRVLYPRFRAAAIEDLRKSGGPDSHEWVEYADSSDLLTEINVCPSDLFVKVLISSVLRVRHVDAVWDAIGTLELDPQAGIVSGPIVSVNDLVLNAGYLAGVEGGIATPYAGWKKADVPGDYWQTRRSVTIAPLLFVAIRSEALTVAGPLGGMDVNDALFGLDFCLRLAQTSYGVVQSPGLEAERDQILSRTVGEGSDAGLHQVTAALALNALSFTLSPHLSRQSNRFGKIARSGEQGLQVTVDRDEAGPAVPLNIQVDPHLASRPTINLLLPVARMSSMSGGPNTALNMAYRLADMGFPLRIISTDHDGDLNQKPLWEHIQSISGVRERLSHVEMVNAADRDRPLSIGVNDVFFATAWWTAQMAKHAVALLGNRPFLYLVQDFEPLFYPTSTAYALALETYGLNHIPIINTSLLRDYLSANAISQHAQQDFLDRALVFEPAVDRALFYREEHDRVRRRLLFYARPSHVRNIYPIGIAALRGAIARGVLSPLQWDFVGMGEQFEPVNLGHGATLSCAPWLGFDDYAREMRHSDILLSLMMSPHPSYPPLEMGSCSGMVVTNTFANKTADRMTAFSERIIAVEPTVDAVITGLSEAVRRVDEPETQPASQLPESWDESFTTIMPEIARRLTGLGLRTDGPSQSVAAVRMPGDGQDDAYTDFLEHSAAKRANLCAADQVPGLLSFATIVWNSAPEFLEVLGRSMRDQIGGTHFEWYVLDNGSTDPATVAAIERLRTLPFVRFERSAENLGIVGGTRRCLERVTGRYMVPVDHDDYVFPDAARVMTWYLQKHGYPPMMYSDETLLEGTRLFMPYMKPDWDPVLFMNSCYTAHLCVIDRQIALDCNAYSDRQAEASPDWDTFTRLSLSGHKPVHVPQVLYGWRVHEQSTAGNIKSKPYVARSQQTVLKRLLQGLPVRDLFEIEASPLFHANADWWVRRKRMAPRPITTILVGQNAEDGGQPDFRMPSSIDHRVLPVHLGTPLSALLPQLQHCIREKRLVHVLALGTYPDDDEWPWEAMGLFELFTDTVMVGGRLHSYDTILAGSFYFGFGRGCDSPDRGRPFGGDPGYFSQFWKPHSVDAVSAQHSLFDPAFLIRAIEAISDKGASIAALGQWAGAVARDEGRRVIYSPFLCARTDTDWTVYVDDQEYRRFNQTYARLMPGNGLLSPNVGLLSASAFVPTARQDFVPSRAGLPLPNYAQYFAARERERTMCYKVRGQETSFSILTPLYSGSDAEMFELTARSVASQSYSQFEWVIIAQGPITPVLEQMLREVARDPRIRIRRLMNNLGIIGGMRHGLEQATGDYVLPLDGDDLLTGDCLQVLAATIAGCAEAPAYLYSDEDIVSGDMLHAPFLRSDWDPVLDLENSWVWHVGLFRRELGVSLGVYTDKGSEYCQDWDTLYRFTYAGHHPLHVPEVLYHWRHHAQSTSNRADPGQGSSQSVQHLLTRKITDKGLQAHCELAPFPIYRGTAEWWVKRKPVDLPRTRCLVLDLASAGVPALPGPLGDDWQVIGGGAGFYDAMAKEVAALESDALVVLLSAEVLLTNFEGVLEAVKLFEFHNDVVAVSGRLVDGDVEVARGLVTEASGRLWAPFARDRLTDAGPFALRWKPASISVPVLDLCVVRASFLRNALDTRPAESLVTEFSLWIGALALSRRERVAFSPLLWGEMRGHVLRQRDELLDQQCWTAFRIALGPAAACKNTGISAYMAKTFEG